MIISLEIALVCATMVTAMKKHIIESVIGFAFTIILTLGFCTFIGHLIGSCLLGLVVGFAIVLAYIGWLVFKL